jgi:hypothetical protein
MFFVVIPTIGQIVVGGPVLCLIELARYYFGTETIYGTHYASC